MIDVERKLITAMIRQNKVGDFVKQGFVSSDFVAFPNILGWILKCSKDGYTITENLLREEFPEFKLIDECYDYGYVLDKFFEDFAKIKARQILLEQPKSMSEWIPKVMVGLSEILQIYGCGMPEGVPLFAL